MRSKPYIKSAMFTEYSKKIVRVLIFILIQPLNTICRFFWQNFVQKHVSPIAHISHPHTQATVCHTADPSVFGCGKEHII